MFSRGKLTNQEGVAIVLLQDPADPGDVLNGKLEHDKFHRGLAHLVVLLQVASTDQNA